MISVLRAYLLLVRLLKNISTILKKTTEVEVLNEAWDKDLTMNQVLLDLKSNSLFNPSIYWTARTENDLL